MSAALIAVGLRALTAAARRAHERGDVEERDRLTDEAFAHLELLIEALPKERRR